MTSWVARISLDNASPKYFRWDTRRKTGEFLIAPSELAASSILIEAGKRWLPGLPADLGR